MHRREITASRIALLTGLIYFGGISFVLPFAQAASGTAGADFLNIPVGAGPAAMGSAYSALATDGYAPVYNPAGLGFVDLPQITGQHLEYLDSVRYEFASFAYPLPKTDFSKIPGNSSLGASIQYLGSGDITRTNLSGDSVGNFSSSYAAYSLSYGRALGEKFALGLTGKMIHGSINGISGSAYAGDVGSLYQSGRLALAAVFTNLGSPLKFIQDSDALPRVLHLGAAYHITNRWLASAESIYPLSGPASVHVGTQWSPLEAVDLRAGYKTDTLKELSPLAGVTAGIGVHVWGQELAYAWAPYGDLGDAQYLSIVIRFGERERLKRNLIRYEAIKGHRHTRSGGYVDDGDEIENQQLMQLLQNGDTRVSESPAPAQKDAQ